LSLYIGIDFGTSGCRAVAIDDRGHEVAEARRAILPPEQKESGHVEQDPLLWWSALDEILQELCRVIPCTEVAALCVDGTSSTLLLCDANGDPVTPALMYNDSRSREEAEMIAHTAPVDSAARGANSSLAKLLNLHAHYGPARYALHQSDWILGRLHGHYGTTDENNALKLGYDPRTGRWPDWLQHLSFPGECLPEVRQPGSTIGTITAMLATRYGLPRTTRIVAGTTDSTAAFLATGACRVADAVTSLGSTLVLKIITSTPIYAPQYGIYSHRIRGQWLCGGASNSGGAVLRHYFSDQEMQELSMKIRPQEPTVLDYYPLPGTGERFPTANPDMKPRLPEFLPQNAEDRAVIFQALLEGIARIEQQGYARLRELGAPWPAQVFSVGGGAINTGWNQIRERMLGVPVRIPEHTQAAYGAALLARDGAGTGYTRD
jgi:hypothetical protein